MDKNAMLIGVVVAIVVVVAALYLLSGGLSQRSAYTQTTTIRSQVQVPANLTNNGGLNRSISDLSSLPGT